MAMLKCHLATVFVYLQVVVPYRQSYLIVVAQFVASLELYQVEFVDDGMNRIIPVEGVASAPIGGSPPRHFAFNCISTTNEQSLSWARQDGITLTLSQSHIVNGAQLKFENAVSSDLTVYVCYNADTEKFVTLNVTNGKWKQRKANHPHNPIDMYICFFDAAYIYMLSVLWQKEHGIVLVGQVN